MKLAFATANLYYLEFERVLEIIRKAGYKYIELDGYWKGSDWETAQHLKGMAPDRVISLVQDYELQIASYHDMGGVIAEETPTIVSEWSKEFLGQINIACLTVHTPHKKTEDENWWMEYEPKAAEELRAWSKKCLVTIENMQNFEEFQVPLLNPEELLHFAKENDLRITLDTMHCALNGLDICDAADILHDRIRTVHLSDYAENKYHALFGEGSLDFQSFYQRLNMDELYATTIECYIPPEDSMENLVKKCEAARLYFEKNIFQKL